MGKILFTEIYIKRNCRLVNTIDNSSGCKLASPKT